MANLDEFRAAHERIRLALETTDSKLDAVRELVLALREQVSNGGVVTEEQLSSLLTLFEEQAAKAEDVAAEAGQIE